MTPLLSLLRHRGLLRLMTLRDLRSKYAGSLIGLFWSVLNPLLLLAVFTFIFTVVFKARFGPREGLAPSALAILCGILPWLAFADAVGRSATVVPENRNLVTRVRFPLAVLPAFPAFSASLGQLAGIVILTGAAAVTLGPPSASLVLFPAVAALQLAFTIGLCLAIAALASYLRDLAHLLPVLLAAWMYATPVFYPPSLVPPDFQLVIDLNPMAGLIEAYRSILLDGAWPRPAALLAASGFALVSLLAGSFLFRKLTPGIADRL